MVTHRQTISPSASIAALNLVREKNQHGQLACDSSYPPPWPLHGTQVRVAS